MLLFYPLFQCIIMLKNFLYLKMYSFFLKCVFSSYWSNIKFLSDYSSQILLVIIFSIKNTPPLILTTGAKVEKFHQLFFVNMSEWPAKKNHKGPCTGSPGYVVTTSGLYIEAKDSLLCLLDKPSQVLSSIQILYGLINLLKFSI